jgi:hypothetical protein
MGGIAERLRCAWCGARWHDGATLRFNETEGAVCCREGSGCSKRPADHERKRGKRTQYLLDGHWYLAAELAALAEIRPGTMRARLAGGWPVARAVREPLRDCRTFNRSAQLQTLLRALRSRARVALWRTTDGRTIAAIADEMGLSASALLSRARRHTLAKAIEMGRPKPGLTSNPNGRPPLLGRSLEEIAREEFGVTRQALWKSARRAGRTIEQEVASRRAANDVREVAA